MKSLLLTVLLVTTTLTGCLATGANSPALNTIQEVNTQYHGALAALHAYCNSVQANDSEVSKVCVDALNAVNSTTSTVEAALAIITGIFAKRAQQEVFFRGLTDKDGPECH